MGSYSTLSVVVVRTQKQALKHGVVEGVIYWLLEETDREGVPSSERSPRLETRKWGCRSCSARWLVAVRR